MMSRTNSGDAVDEAAAPPNGPHQIAADASTVQFSSQTKSQDGEEHPPKTSGRSTPRNPPSETDSTRGKWGGKFEFTLTCLGYAVGLGNVWRFPTEVFANGGGTFFVPYFMMLFFCGIPLFFLEVTHGQFRGQGVTVCWDYAPLFKGIGFAMMAVTTMISIYYNVVVAWILYFLINSFTIGKLPWEECHYGSWATASCLRLDLEDCCDRKCSDCNSDWLANATDGTCYTIDKSSSDVNTVAYYKRVSTLRNDFPAQQYLDNHVYGKGTDYSLENLGTPQWELLGCLALAWVTCALCISKGIKTAGKVSYVTALLPYLMLVILLIFALVQYPDASLEGIKYYLTPDMDKLSEAEPWRRAAVQIFFSLSCLQGGHITLSSYNEMHNDLMKNVIIVGLGNSSTSIFAGFVIFSYLGILADAVCVDVAAVVKGGTGLAFVVYPTAVTYLPAPPLWSVLFFMMLLSLGINSEFVLVETILTGIRDVFPFSRRHKTPLAVALCGLFFVLGIPQIFQGGSDLLDLVDTYSTGFNSLIVGLVYSFSIFYVYGWRRYFKDIEFMIGADKKYCFIPWRFWRMFWLATLGFIGPALLLFILIFNLILLDPPKALAAKLLSVGISSLIPVLLIAPMLMQLFKAEGDFVTRLRNLTTPTPEWGPTSQRMRAAWREYTGRSPAGQAMEGGGHGEVLDDVTDGHTSGSEPLSTAEENRTEPV